MIEKVIERKVYVALDGKEFDTESDCIAYENKLNACNWKVYQVSVQRVFTGYTVTVKASSQKTAEEIALDCWKGYKNAYDNPEMAVQSITKYEPDNYDGEIDLIEDPYELDDYIICEYQ